MAYNSNSDWREHGVSNSFHFLYRHNSTCSDLIDFSGAATRRFAVLLQESQIS